MIDAGTAAHDAAAVQEGVTIYRYLYDDDKNNLGCAYNLANGLTALARLQFTPGMGWANWYVTTHEWRRQARLLFQAVSRRAPHRARARALINLGNALDAGFRWVEAYDKWVEAIAADPTNRVSTLSIARMLLRRIATGRHGAALHRLAGYYARRAIQGHESIRDIAGPEGAAAARRLPSFRSHWRPRDLSKIRDAYGRFIAQHRLALVGTVEGLDLRRRRWDDVSPPAIVTSMDASIPTTFAMVNALKADYCIARWLAFEAMNGGIRETGTYADTGDHARYGTKPSGLVLAQRAAADVLDRVAVCSNEYFRFGLNPQDIHFGEFWRSNSGVGPWQPHLEKEIASGNPGVIALGELAADLSEGSLLGTARPIRNIGTHRFHTLHDEEDIPEATPAIARHRVQEFEAETLTTLQIARSSILYLLDAIAFREKRDRPKGTVGTVPLPPHDWVRGR